MRSDISRECKTGEMERKRRDCIFDPGKADLSVIEWKPCTFVCSALSTKVSVYT